MTRSREHPLKVAIHKFNKLALNAHSCPLYSGFFTPSFYLSDERVTKDKKCPPATQHREGIFRFGLQFPTNMSGLIP